MSNSSGIFTVREAGMYQLAFMGTIWTHSKAHAQCYLLVNDKASVKRNSCQLYRGEHNPWVKGLVCLGLEFALPPFSPSLPSVVEVSKQNRH